MRVSTLKRTLDGAVAKVPGVLEKLGDQGVLYHGLAVLGGGASEQRAGPQQRTTRIGLRQQHLVRKTWNRQQRVAWSSRSAASRTRPGIRPRRPRPRFRDAPGRNPPGRTRCCLRPAAPARTPPPAPAAASPTRASPGPRCAPRTAHVSARGSATPPACRNAPPPAAATPCWSMAASTSRPPSATTPSSLPARRPS